MSRHSMRRRKYTAVQDKTRKQHRKQAGKRECSHQSDQQMVENPICRFLSEVLPRTAGSGTTLDSNLINMAHEAPPFTATNHHPTVAGRPFQKTTEKIELVCWQKLETKRTRTIPADAIGAARTIEIRRDDRIIWGRNRKTQAYKPQCENMINSEKITRSEKYKNGLRNRKDQIGAKD